MNSFAESAFSKHYRTIHGFILRRVRDHARADDLAQQVFVDAVSTLDSAQPEQGSALAWLYTVARRRLADEAKRQARNDTLQSRVEAEVSASGQVEYGPRLAAVLSEATAELGDESREVLVRHLLRGQSFPELARELDVSEAALKMRYVRALRALRSHLEQKGFEP